MSHWAFGVILTCTAYEIVPRITLNAYKRIPVVYGIGVKFMRSRVAASNCKQSKILLKYSKISECL